MACQGSCQVLVKVLLVRQKRHTSNGCRRCCQLAPVEVCSLYSAFQKRHFIKLRLRVFHLVAIKDVCKIEDFTCTTIPSTQEKIFQIMGCSKVTRTLLYHTQALRVFLSCMHLCQPKCLHEKGIQWRGIKIPQSSAQGKFSHDCVAPLPSQ